MKAAVLRASVAVCVAAPASSVRLAGESPSVLMIPDEGEAARYWARWRGPSGQGAVSAGGYTDKWSATERGLEGAAARRRQLVPYHLARPYLPHHLGGERDEALAARLAGLGSVVVPNGRGGSG
jgi:hypothetical protein